MANLSKIKREELIRKIEELKLQYTTDEDTRLLLNNIISELTQKKYGLVWEKHSENVDKMMIDNIPVFSEIEDKRIIAVPDDAGTNFLLEGDNLHSLKLLEKTHKERIDVIYIDPPYNRGKDDFIYDDAYIDRLDSYRHSKWLSFMEERLRIAERLLSKDGVIFISIDENEYAQCKLLCDDIFDEAHFMECIVWNKRVPKNDKGIGNIHEYILLYTKSEINIEDENKRKFMMPKDGLDEIFDFVENMKKNNVPLDEAENRLKAFYNKKGYDRAITLYCQLDKNYEVFGKINMCWPNGNSMGPAYEVLHPILKEPVKVPSRGWRWTQDTLFSVSGYDRETASYKNMEERFDGSVVCTGDNSREGLWFSDKLTVQPSSIKYLRDLDRMLFRSIYSTKSDGSMALENIFGEKNVFSYPKPPKLIYDLLDSALYGKKNAIILDFFAGSGTTGEAVVKLSKDNNADYKFILCTNNEISVFQKLKYIHDNGYMLDYSPARTSKIDTVAGKINKFLLQNSDLNSKLFEETNAYESYGICKSITYPRLKKVIEGYEGEEALPFNLRYYKTDYVSKVSSDPNYFIEDKLMEHIIEMIQLETGTSVDNDKYIVLLTDEEVERFEKNIENYHPIKIYIDQTVFLSQKIKNKLDGTNVEILPIPDYYFANDIKGGY